MRVLMTTDTIGGVWTFTRELICGLLDKGCEITLVSFGREPSAEQQRWSAKIEACFHGRFHYISSSAPLEWMQANDRALSETSQLLLNVDAEFNADVLHANQFCFGALPMALPKVVTAHSDVLSWSDACRRGPLPESDWLQRYCTLVQNGISGATVITGPTCSMLHELSRNFVVSETPCVIVNGRSLPCTGDTARRLQAVTAGRVWDEAKGISMLQDVVSPMMIMVAGESALDVDAVASTSGMVSFLGQLAEDNLLSLFKESSVYICTSKYEPFGLAPLEAALCGCALLCNDLPSLREVWGDAALYFHDAASLSKLLSRVHGDASFLKAVQMRCHTRAQRYSRDQMASAYLQLYERLSEQQEDLGDVA